MSSTSSEVLRADKIWIDGKLVKWDEGHVHLMTHALHYGLGVFEGIRAYRTKDGRLAVFRLRDHIRRLYDSAHICLLKLPYSEDALAEACCELLRAQKDRFANTGAYLRPIAFMGDGAMGLGAVNPTRMAIAAWDWGAYLGEKGLKEGIRAKVSSFTRMHVNVNMVRGKITGQYVNSSSPSAKPSSPATTRRFSWTSPASWPRRPGRICSAWAETERFARRRSPRRSWPGSRAI